MQSSEIVELLKQAKTEEERIEILVKSFREIEDLTLLTTTEQKEYAKKFLEIIGPDPGSGLILQAYFELGKLFKNPASRTAGW